MKAKEDIKHATNFHQIKLDYNPNYDRDITSIEELLKETGDEALTKDERKRYESYVEGHKKFNEIYEGYFT